MNEICVLLSGGIDSTVLLYWLKSKKYSCHPLIINYGQVSFEGEYKAAKKITEILDFGLKKIDVREISKNVINKLTSPDISNESFYPNRNMFLLIIGAMIAYENDFEAVGIGLIKTELYPDSSEKFIKNFEDTNCISLDKRIAIVAPFINLNKIDIIEIGKRLNVPFNITFSCLTNSDEHCEKCEGCIDRKRVIDIYGKQEKY